MKTVPIDAHKDEMIENLFSKKEKIKKLVSMLNKPKQIKIELDLAGNYEISTRSKRLTPNNQEHLKRAYYDYSLSVKPEEYEKRTWASRITEKLLSGISDIIERTSWYC